MRSVRSLCWAVYAAFCVWGVSAGAATPTIGPDLADYSHTQWTAAVAEGPDWNSAPGISMLLDQRGDLWASSDKGVWRLDRKAERLVKVMDGGGQLLFAPDGRLWQLLDAATIRFVAQSGGARPAA